MSDFNVQGWPIKRKRGSSCNRAGSGDRDVGEMRKDADFHHPTVADGTLDAESKQGEVDIPVSADTSQSTVLPSNNEPPAKEEKVSAGSLTALASSAEPFQPVT
jgi:hypothetical protein